MSRQKKSSGIYRHAAIALSSFDKAPIDLFRVLEGWPSTWPQPATYSQAAGCSELNIINCHNGQRKLILSVLEFMSIALARLAKRKKTTEETVVVYAGASGLAATIAASFFPDVRFILYDPAPNTVALIDKSSLSKDVMVYRRANAKGNRGEDKRIVVYTDDAGWFTDEVAKALSTELKGKHVLFISDIRVSNDENAIVEDMLAQQRWTRVLGASGYMFKFRVPYDASLVSRYYEGRRQSRDGLQSHKMPYLDGSLHIQIYPRPTTAELRLIGFRAGVGRYRERMYDIADIENKMATFNAVYRSNALFKIKGAVGAYEPMAEASILMDVAKLSGNSVNAVRTLLDTAVDRFIHGKKTATECAATTGVKRVASCRNSKEALARLASCGRPRVTGQNR